MKGAKGYLLHVFILNDSNTQLREVEIIWSAEGLAKLAIVGGLATGGCSFISSR